MLKGPRSQGGLSSSSGSFTVLCSPEGVDPQSILGGGGEDGVQESHRILGLDREKCHRYGNLVCLLALSCQRCPSEVIFHQGAHVLKFLYSFSNCILFLFAIENLGQFSLLKVELTSPWKDFDRSIHNAFKMC